MRSHELATQLTKLAKVLKQGPDFDLDFANSADSFYRKMYANERNERFSQGGNLPIALEALLSLSSIDKTEWANLILDLGLPIEIRPRDASRDLLGKVLSVLERDPVARDQLKHLTKHSNSRASPELMRALSSLLAK